MNQENRTRTGIQGLDRNLEGGFPRGSMIVVAGNPGTGKTMLCGAFLHHGALQGENGLYVSFSEGRETFISNMRRFGLDFESTRSNRVEILDFITSKEPGVDAIMEMITERIEVNRAERSIRKRSPPPNQVNPVHPSPSICSKLAEWRAPPPKKA